MKPASPKARLAARRALNQRLAAEDAKHRCGTCKQQLPKTGVQMRWGDPRMYCSAQCLADADQRASR